MTASDGSTWSNGDLGPLDRYLEVEPSRSATTPPPGPARPIGQSSTPHPYGSIGSAGPAGSAGLVNPNRRDQAGSSSPEPAPARHATSRSRRPRRLALVGAVLVAIPAVGLGAWWLLGDDETAAPPPEEELGGLVFGSVEDADGAGMDAVEIVVTRAETDEELGRATSDPLGLFEIDLGDHRGPVVVRATHQDQHAATVAAVSADGATTGIRLVVGAPGTGAIDGRVSADGGATLEGGALIEARFVETGRTDVMPLAADGTFRFEALPLDGDLILVATTADGSLQGLTATAVSESQASNSADLVLRSPSEAAHPDEAGDAGDHEIVSEEDLTDWVIDGPVTVVPADDITGD
jgi:hypothetical protein